MTKRTAESTGLDPSEIRGRLAGARGPQYWRSLEELAGSDAFQEYLGREFPSQAAVWADPTSRRQFLQLMGASLALAGINGCAFQPPESIVPYVRAPEEVVPGQPLFFATALPLGGYATGVLVESHQGRPIKVEGNPDHPASLGGTDPFLQAAVLTLYDPDRSQVITRNGRISTWDDFLAVLVAIREAKLAGKGQGLRLLTETVTSPTLAHQLQELRAAMPEARWYQHEPVGRDASREGALRALGEVVEPIYDFTKADVILSLDADFLAWSPSRLRDAHDFTARREVAPDATARMNRLYVIESSSTITGAMADHRMPVRASAVRAWAQALARRLGVEGSEAAAEVLPAEWLDAVVKDLEAHRGTSLVLAGDGQPWEVHALAHAINHALENVGPDKPLHYIAPVAAEPDGSLVELVRDMKAGQVDTLLILGSNPLYTAPADLDLRGGLARVLQIIHLGLYADETAALSNWHVPEAHVLEAWGDVRAFDGTVTIQQPLIAPLYGGRTTYELLDALLGRPNRPGLEVIREYWMGQSLAGDFETAWRTALHQGVVAGTDFEARDVMLKPLPETVWAGVKGTATATAAATSKTAAAGELELVFRPDPTIWDGRFANNAWLQELPKPLTKLTWDNAALVSPRTAGDLGLKVDELTGEADVVILRFGGGALRIPIWIVPGQPDGSVTVTLGYGRPRAGRVGTRVATRGGSNAYTLRRTDAPWFGAGLQVETTNTRYRLAVTQQHHRMEGRHLVRHATAAAFREDPDFAREPDHHFVRELTLYEDPLPQLRREEEGLGNAWGMAINTNTCIGCNACVVACQAENNIPVVGKDEVLRSREMHWIRVDRYFEGDAGNPHTYFQPVPCMHCEKAPCEVVCPVAATTHSVEGLNEMTYNRCVGTKYCSNNCPYKVRRFNFFQYHDETTPSLKLLNNPDVTVRSLGVMEKCTYCVQRINAARIAAEMNDPPRAVGGDAVETACQGACPTRAIVFGNLNDRTSAVVKAKADPRNYALLAELNTRPRTTYLARLHNPNPQIEPPQTEEAAHDGDHAS